MKDRYLVLGNPIEHSLSPEIHRQFASQTGQLIEYDRRLVNIGEFEAALQMIRQEGVSGANVTVPFKEAAFSAATRVSLRARNAGAANTLVFWEDGSIHADNTDGVGLVSDIKIAHQVDIAGKRVLILGAGGAVRGVLKPLLDEAPASITIANRTIEKARLLQAIYKDAFPIAVENFSGLADRQFDMVINGTSLGLQGQVVSLPPAIFSESALAYDMMYGNGSLPFLEWAESQGAGRVLDGLGMLVGQAAESFYVWRGIRPDTAPVIQAMRTRLESELAS